MPTYYDKGGHECRKELFSPNKSKLRCVHERVRKAITAALAKDGTRLSSFGFTSDVFCNRPAIRCDYLHKGPQKSLDILRESSAGEKEKKQNGIRRISSEH